MESDAILAAIDRLGVQREYYARRALTAQLMGKETEALELLSRAECREALQDQLWRDYEAAGVALQSFDGGY